MEEEEVNNDENPYNEKAREEQLDNEEMDSAEEGFLKGYDEEASEKPEISLDEDEQITD